MNRTRGGRLVAVPALVLLCAGGWLWVRTEREAGALVEIDGPVTYYPEVARIVQDRCQTCHHSGGVAPFPLERYAQVYARRTRIYDAVRDGVMPPWPLDPDVGHWANDRSLTTHQRASVLAWIDQGAPEGDPSLAPPSRTWPREWATIGTPDATVRIPEPIEVPASGVVPYRYVFAETNFPEDRWIRGFQIQPSAPEVAHHILVFLEEPAFAGEDISGTIVREGFQTGSDPWFAAYGPGSQGTMFPEGTARLLPKGATLKFQLHYAPNGRPATDQTEIGFVFAESPPEYMLETGVVTTLGFAIPPGAKHHEVTAVQRIEDPVTVLALVPHMHMRGSEFRFELHSPDGARETLLEMPDWDFKMQDAYWLERPRTIPTGYWIRATGWFDNSKRNPSNPDPTQTVRYGEQSYEEMMYGYYLYTIRNPDFVG